MLQNGYINTSVQKAGVPGLPGFLEHAALILNIIQYARKEKRDLHVVWLDLASAYGSVPHVLIEKAMRVCWIPEKVINLTRISHEQFFMRFTTPSYTTNWQSLEVGIPMGCVVSPLLFVMAMELIDRAAKVSERE